MTGASSGIGAETVRHLAANMVTVVVNGRNPDELSTVAASIEAAGSSAMAVAANCTRLEIVSRSSEG